ncbi:MAG: bifunctional precorrin-2 dehydrogenase/sirohydrochlorin ferrochelatase, partial [Lachnospiraceae bacterium]|nr:bifunctional precorrin-2 dehydrogenase/sirohydrochlorin ferrochelatase [Lachnospiraceae bacterium]
VQVIAPDISLDIQELGRNESCLLIVARIFVAEDLKNVDLVIAATNQEDVNRHIMELCDAQKILANNAGSRSTQGIHFGSVIRRGPILIGISTNGTSPALNARIKSDIEELLPEYYEKVAQSLDQYREYVNLKIDDQELRSQIYKKLVYQSIQQEGNLCIEDVEKIMLEQTGGQVDGEN